MEVLVVIVVFLIGILAIVQIFPGGFRLLAQSRNQSIAQQLDRSVLALASGQPDGLPEQILPVNYVLSGGVLDVVTEPFRQPGDLSALGNSMDSNGFVSNSGLVIGYWPYVSGPNVMRRIVAEGHRIPSPRSVGTDFGGFLTLSFAPVLTDTDDFVSTLTYKPAFEVYGADLIDIEGAPTTGVVPDYEFYLDQANGSGATLYLPRSTPDAAGADPRTYRVSMTVWVKDAANNVTRRDVVGTIDVPSDPAGGYQTVPIATDPSNLAQLQPAETLDSVEPESVRIAREFYQVSSFTFDPGDPGKKPIRPYEYRTLNWKLGQLLFSPAGYNVYESRPQGRVPLIARVTYDVFDWRIVHDDFRIPDTSGLQYSPPQYKLTLSSLRVKGNHLPDGRIFNGLNVPLDNFDGTNVIHNDNRDFALIDNDTGAVYLPSSYQVDRSAGVITFLDADNNPSNGLQLQVIYPGDNVVSTIDASGRSVRALYMGNFDWSVQMLKAAAQYLQTYSQPTVGQYYVGGSSAYGGSPVRIYFPWADVNQKIKIGEVFYLSTDGTVHSLKDQDFLVTASPADPLGLPYVDVKNEVASDAVNLDSTTYGFAVANVQGISVTSRALWNPETFTLTNDAATNMGLLDKFRAGYRRTNLDTVVQRGDNL